MDYGSSTDLLGWQVWRFSAVLGIVEPLGNFPEQQNPLLASSWGRGGSGLTSPFALGQETLCSQNCGLGEFYFGGLNTS